MASAKVRNANQSKGLTLESISHEELPKDEVKQVVRAALIFVLLGLHRSLYTSLHPATRLALDIFNKKGPTSLARMQAVEAVKAYKTSCSGRIFEEDDVSSEVDIDSQLVTA